MLKKFILFSLALFIISCGSDNPTNPDYSDFDFGMTENKEWVYDMSLGDETQKGLLESKLDTAPDGTPCVRIIETNIELGASITYGYYKEESNKLTKFHLGIKKSDHDPIGVDYSSFWETKLDLNKDSWVVKEYSKDTTDESGVSYNYSLTIESEIIDRSTANFQGVERRTITVRTTYRETEIATPLNETSDEYRDLRVEDITYMDGVGMYKHYFTHTFNGIDDKEVTFIYDNILTDYKEK